MIDDVKEDPRLAAQDARFVATGRRAERALEVALRQCGGDVKAAFALLAREAQIVRAARAEVRS